MHFTRLQANWASQIEEIYLSHAIIVPMSAIWQTLFPLVFAQILSIFSVSL